MTTSAASTFRTLLATQRRVNTGPAVNGGTYVSVFESDLNYYDGDLDSLDGHYIAHHLGVADVTDVCLAMNINTGHPSCASSTP